MELLRCSGLPISARGARTPRVGSMVISSTVWGSVVGWVVGLSFGEVEAGDLEAVEEEAGAAGIDVVGGDALQDLADGGLDRGSVFR